MEAAGFTNVSAWNQFVPFVESDEDLKDGLIGGYYRARLPDGLSDELKE